MSTVTNVVGGMNAPLTVSNSHSGSGSVGILGAVGKTASSGGPEGFSAGYSSSATGGPNSQVGGNFNRDQWGEFDLGQEIYGPGVG